MLKDTINLGKFPLGANNTAPDTALPEGSLRSVVNADVDDAGNIVKKDGHLKIYDGEGCHSLFKNYFVEGDKLKQIQDDNSVIEIETVSSNRYLAWTSLFGDNYYSDGLKGYIIGRGEWGVPVPNASPVLTEQKNMGRLDAGTYQVAICYRNSDGELGGATKINSITVEQNSAIICTNIPSDFRVVIYVSQPNGTTLYTNVETTGEMVSITQSRNGTKVLSTQFCSVVPGGHIIRFHHARLYVANGNILWFSRAGHFGIHEKDKDWFQFGADISIVQPVENGLYIVADKTYFLAGREPDKANLRVVSDDAGIKGTGFSIGGKAFGKPFDDIVGFWYSKRGAILGLGDGTLEHLTEDRYAIKDGLESGCTTLNENNGFKRLITSLSNSGQESDLEYSLQLTSTIIRNGVVVD